MGLLGRMASVKGRSRCKVCGKPLSKEFTTVFHDGEDFNTDRINLEKQYWEQQEHVCSRCKDSTTTDISKKKLISLLGSYENIANMVNTVSNEMDLGNVVPTEVNKEFVEYIKNL